MACKPLPHTIPCRSPAILSPLHTYTHTCTHTHCTTACGTLLLISPWSHCLFCSLQVEHFDQISRWHSSLIWDLCSDTNESGKPLVTIFLKQHCLSVCAHLSYFVTLRALSTTHSYLYCLLWLPELDYKLKESRRFPFPEPRRQSSTERCSIDIG